MRVPLAIRCAPVAEQSRRVQRWRRVQRLSKREKCHAIREACRRGDSNLDACHAGRPCATRASCGPATGFTAGSKRVLPGYREYDAPVTGDNRKPQLERAAFRVEGRDMSAGRRRSRHFRTAGRGRPDAGHPAARNAGRRSERGAEGQLIPFRMNAPLRSCWARSRAPAGRLFVGWWHRRSNTRRRGLKRPCLEFRHLFV